MPFKDKYTAISNSTIEGEEKELDDMSMEIFKALSKDNLVVMEIYNKDENVRSVCAAEYAVLVSPIFESKTFWIHEENKMLNLPTYSRVEDNFFARKITIGNHSLIVAPNKFKFIKTVYGFEGTPVCDNQYTAENIVRYVFEFDKDSGELNKAFKSAILEAIDSIEGQVDQITKMFFRD